jgi:hypothetical protein
MRVVSRRALGCTDEFEGFVLFKEETPVAQFHSYEDYNTFFWLGHTSLQSLGECLWLAAEEICKRLDLPFDSLNKGFVQYEVEGGRKSIPIEIVRDRWGVYAIRPTANTVSYAKAARQATFARFDLQSTSKLPVILWADLTDTEDSEVGFSTTVETPAAIFRLLQSTCRVALSDAELEEIRGQVLDLTLVPAG